MLYRINIVRLEVERSENDNKVLEVWLIFRVYNICSNSY
jgi:hypothetical protein